MLPIAELNARTPSLLPLATMADTSDKSSSLEVVTVDKPADSNKVEVASGGGLGERSADRWATTRWELWTFYIYYIVRSTIQMART